MSLEAQIRQALAELELVSHAPTMNYDGHTRPSTDESKGGKKPSGSDREFRPADADERTAWEASYHRRTVGFFRRELARRGSSEALLAEVRETVDAWKQQPVPARGVEPERESFHWRCTIADDPRDSKSVQKFYGVSRSTVKRYRAAYRGVMRTVWTTDG